MTSKAVTWIIEDRYEYGKKHKWRWKVKCINNGNGNGNSSSTMAQKEDNSCAQTKCWTKGRRIFERIALVTAMTFCPIFENALGSQLIILIFRIIVYKTNAPFVNSPMRYSSLMCDRYIMPFYLSKSILRPSFPWLKIMTWIYETK